MEGSGVGIGKYPEDMGCSLLGSEARHLVGHVTTNTVPVYDPSVYVHSFSKRLVAFCVIRVYGLPRWQDEH